MQETICWSYQVWYGIHDAWNDTGWETVSSKVRSGGEDANIWKWALVRRIIVKWIQESFEDVSTVTSPACASLWAFIWQPTHREVIWVVDQKGGEEKTFLQNYIKYNYRGQRVIVTDIATSTKDIAYFLSKFPLECKDIFLFNHPCSTTETIAYDMLEGIKDGHKVSAKYDTRGIFSKAPSTVIVFSNEFPVTGALKKDRWSIYEIKGEELYN